MEVKIFEDQKQIGETRLYESKTKAGEACLRGRSVSFVQGKKTVTYVTVLGAVSPARGIRLGDTEEGKKLKK